MNAVTTGRLTAAIVIPCLNEEEPIFDVVRDVLAEDIGQVLISEVIVVDNGSTDRTAERAQAAGARVVREPRRGYGRACAAGLAAVGAGTEIVCFIDGDGSDVPSFIAAVVAPVAAGAADFVMGSRLRGRREPGSMTAQQIAAGWLAGLLLRLTYGVRFTDMSPLRAMRVDTLKALGMAEQTYGWNLEMQMRAAARGLRILEIAVDHRCRRGGESKVSGNLAAGLSAAWKITITFLRLAATLRRDRRQLSSVIPHESGEPNNPRQLDTERCRVLDPRLRGNDTAGSQSERFNLAGSGSSERTTGGH
jgi:glycosyltransferase involved in cell wall biosynthesis